MLLIHSLGVAFLWDFCPDKFGKDPLSGACSPIIFTTNQHDQREHHNSNPLLATNKMSAYPTCYHGHDDPNTDCEACETERRWDVLNGELEATRTALEEVTAERDEARRFAEAYRHVWELCAAAVDETPNPDPLPWKFNQQHQ